MIFLKLKLNNNFYWEKYNIYIMSDENYKRKYPHNALPVISFNDKHIHPLDQVKKAHNFLFDNLCNVIYLSEHFIYELCYIKSTHSEYDHLNIYLHYLDPVTDEIDILLIDNRGKFTNIDGNRQQFPCGFFDATVYNYLRIHG